VVEEEEVEVVVVVHSILVDMQVHMRLDKVHHRLVDSS